MDKINSAFMIYIFSKKSIDLKNSQKHTSPASKSRKVSISVYLNDGLNLFVPQLLQGCRQHIFKMMGIQQRGDAEQEHTFDGRSQQCAAIVIEHAGHGKALLHFRELITFDELLRMRSKERNGTDDSAPAGLAGRDLLSDER